jgi:DNA repair ATPase RecN
LYNSGFFITTRPATRSATKERQQEEMDQRLGNMEQLMKSLSDSHEEFRKSQQTMQDRMTEIHEMLAKHQMVRIHVEEITNTKEKILSNFSGMKMNEQR